MFATLMAAAAAEGTASHYGFPIHPGEDPTEKEEEEWWRVVDRIADSTEIGALARGESPASFARFKTRTLNTDMSIMTVPVEDASNFQQRMAIIKHNQTVQAILDENAQRAAAEAAHIVQLKRGLAAALDAAMLEAVLTRTILRFLGEYIRGLKTDNVSRKFR